MTESVTPTPDLTHTPSRGVLIWPDPLKEGGYPRISPEAEPAYLLAIIPHNIGMTGREIDGNGRLFNAARNMILGLAARLKTDPVLLAELLESGALLRAIDGLESIAAGPEPLAASLASAAIKGMKPHLNPPPGSTPRKSKPTPPEAGHALELLMPHDDAEGGEHVG